MLQCDVFAVQAFSGKHVLPLSPSTAHTELTTWLSAMASWEWNVECCVCRAPFPASLTAQAHANDQYYWSTIDGLATKQEKLITTKALLSFNYGSSMAISAAQRCSPTLISNKMWCGWRKKNLWRWKVDKIIWLSVCSAETKADLRKVWEDKRTAEGSAYLNWKLSQNRIGTWYFSDLGKLKKKPTTTDKWMLNNLFPKFQQSLQFVLSLNDDF